MPVLVTQNGFQVISVVQPQQEIISVVGQTFSQGGGGGSTSIASAGGTIAVTGTQANVNLEIAQQLATVGQALIWNGTKWAPSAVTAVPQVFSGAGAPSGITPTTTAALYYDTVSTSIYEWINNAWVLASGGSGGANFLYQLQDVSVQETGGTFGPNLLTPPTPRIIGYTDSYLQLNAAIAVAASDRLASQNTNPSGALVVQSVQTVGPLFQINFASGVFNTWAAGGVLTQAIYKYTPTILAANRALVWDGTSMWRDAAIVNSVVVNGGAMLSQGSVNFVNGTNTTVVRNNDGSIQINASGGGGGGGSFSSAAAAWASGGTSKDAFTAPSTINNQGIVINLVASGGSGSITNATVSLNGSALATTYSSTGTFPNYTITVPVADVTGNAAQTANSVAVSVVGTFNSANFNVSAGMLTNVQPTPFTTTLSGSYVETALPFYNTTATLNYSYTNASQITSFGGVFTPTQTPLLPRNATAPSGQFTNIDSRGAAISGSATGNGLNGAATGVVITLTGSVAAVPSFIPAFYAGASTGNTPPTFTTSSLQTPGAEVGSIITYTTATAATQFVWLATTRPITSVRQVTAFGQAVVTADVSGTQVISGTTFNVFGFSSLSITTPVVLTIIS